MSWGAVRLRVGVHYCPEHGEVRPRRELVPACPHCLRAAHLGVAQGGTVITQEPAPRTCAGPGRHRLGPGTVSLGTSACRCAPDGLHRTWTCRACGDVQQWPPHDETGAAPYYGPGAGHARG